MEPFEIKEAYSRKNFIADQQFINRLHNISHVKQLIVSLLIAIGLTVYGFLTLKTGKVISFPLFLAGCMGFQVFVQLYELFNLRERQRKAVNAMADRMDKTEAIATILFNDQQVHYSDSERSLWFNWTNFSHYSIYEGRLVIWTNSLVFLTVNLKDLERAEVLIESVSQKLSEKKVKTYLN